MEIYQRDGMALKYKRGIVFKNKHTHDYFVVTASRQNCGFPFYYLKLIQRSPDTYYVRLTQDEYQLKDHWIEWTPNARILYGDR